MSIARRHPFSPSGHDRPARTYNRAMTDPRRILVVEDDANIAAQLVRGLRRAGFATDLCTDGAAAGQQLFRERYDFAILDLNLPERDGFALLQAWRTRSNVPVLVLTARTDLTARLRIFDLGATDWMSKPFYMQELLARIRTRLDDQSTPPRRTVCWADVEVDLDRRAVRVAGRDAALTPHEFNVLAYLVQRPGRVASRRQLSEAALPLAGDRDEKTINSHIARIRKKLGPASTALATIRGAGYCFEPPPEAA